jgi:hypothetical protein
MVGHSSVPPSSHRPVPFSEIPGSETLHEKCSEFAGSNCKSNTDQERNDEAYRAIPGKLRKKLHASFGSTEKGSERHKEKKRQKGVIIELPLRLREFLEQRVRLGGIETPI